MMKECFGCLIILSAMLALCLIGVGFNRGNLFVVIVGALCFILSLICNDKIRHWSDWDET